VYNFVKNASREQIGIIHFWADGAGTYTPAGHWNAIAADDFITKDFSEIRWARNMALLNMSLMDAAIVCWNTKFYYFNPRPSQMNPTIKTLTGVPNFPSYISGHSTFSGAAAEVLSHLILKKQLFTRQWHRQHLCQECRREFITEAIARRVRSW
jgi:membrane-associated phospholipid phosphatase